MNGLIYIFTGEGKGKTSAALGMALRAVCDGKKVAWIAWYKEPTWDVSEYKAEEILGKNFSMYIGGKGFYFGNADKEKIETKGNIKIAKTNTGIVVDKVSEDEHKVAASLSLQKLGSILTEKNTDVLICDELAQAAGEGLVDIQEVLSVLESRGATHIVLTGRNCPKDLIDVADTVTEMKKIKHAYDTGIMAVKGLDF